MHISQTQRIAQAFEEAMESGRMESTTPANKRDDEEDSETSFIELRGMILPPHFCLLTHFPPETLQALTC